jgi:PDZ domain-containing secreted protein
MNTTVSSRVVRIATEVRQWIEARDKRMDYPSHDMNGWCAIASAELHRRLAAEGIYSVLFMSEGAGAHVFIVVDDHVVDITATQFREFEDTKIVVLHTKEAEQYDFYETSQMFETPQKLRKYQVRNHWPGEQIALPS